PGRQRRPGHFHGFRRHRAGGHDEVAKIPGAHVRVLVNVQDVRFLRRTQVNEGGRDDAGQHQQAEDQKLALKTQPPPPPGTARRPPGAPAAPGRATPGRRRPVAEEVPVVWSAPGLGGPGARSDARHYTVPSRHASAGAIRATVHAGYSAATAPTAMASATPARPASSTFPAPGPPAAPSDENKGANTVFRRGNASAPPTTPPMPARTADSATTSRTMRP